MRTRTKVMTLTLVVAFSSDLCSLLVIDDVFRVPIMAVSLVLLALFLRVTRNAGEAAETPARPSCLTRCGSDQLSLLIL